MPTTSSQSIRKYDRWLKQRRAVGRSPASRDERAAFLQGDIQARYALADKARDRELEERRLKMMQDYQNRQLSLADATRRDKKRYLKYAGGIELAKLGIMGLPQIKGAGEWMTDKFRGGTDYELGDFSRPSGVEDVFTTDSYDYQLGDLGMGEGTIFDSSDFGMDFDTSWFWE